MFSRILPATACWLMFGALTAYGNELDESSPRRLAVSRDGKRFALVSEDKRVRIWDADTGKLIASGELDLPGTAVAFSPDGKMLIVGTSGIRTEVNQRMRGYMYGWSFLDGQLKRKWKTPIDGDLMAIAFHHNGNSFVANTFHTSLVTYRADYGKVLREFHDLVYSPSALTLSLDGQTIVTAEQTSILWTAILEKEPEEIAVQEKPLAVELRKRVMKSKSASADLAATMVSAGGAWAIAVGSFVNAKGKPIDVVQIDMKAAKIKSLLAKEIEGFKCLTLPPHEKILAIGLDEGTILLIDLETKGQTKLKLDEKDRIRSIAYVNGGKKLLVATEGGRKLVMIDAESGRVTQRLWPIK